MNLLSKSIVLSSIAGVSLYGLQQLRQPADLSSERKTTDTHTKHDSNYPVNKKEGNKAVIAKKQKITLAKPEAAIFPIDLENDFEQGGQEMTEFQNQGHSEVSFKNGLLTVNAENAVLADVLAQIASKANIPVNSETIDPEQRITLSVEKTSIDTVLRELLTGYDYFFLYSANKNRLQAAWIYSAGTGQTIALIDHENRPKELIEDDLYSSDPVSRVLALQRYANSDTEESTQRIKDAIEDDDPNVRTTAILTAQDNAIELSVTTLKELAKSDPSPTVRSVALNTLSMNSELSPTQITELVEIALDDPEESIREEAEAILEGLAESENKEFEPSVSQQYEDEVEIEGEIET